MMMTGRGWNCQRALGHFLGVALIAFSITSCNHYSKLFSPPFELTQENRTLVRDGMVAISRSAPLVDGRSSKTNSLMGFIPASLHGAPTGTWLAISRDEGSITLMKGDQVISQLKGEGFELLKAGSFKVKHKQRNPLWFAPDSYFQERNQEPPAEGDKARYRRGALGDFVVFADQDIPIHSGPIWLNSIGGLKMEEADLSKIYYSLEVGSSIEIK